MPQRAFDDPTLPPPGQRSGTGSASILPYLLKSLATRPQGPTVDPLPRHAPGPSARDTDDCPDRS